MKHIAILTGYFRPEFVGIAVHATDLVHELAKVGIRSHVYTAMPHYPDWSIWRDYRRSIFRKESQNGSTIFRSWLYVPTNANQIKNYQRIIYEVTFVCLQFLNIVVHLRYIIKSELVIVFSPPFLQGLNALILSCVLRKKVIFHVEDIQPDSAVDLGMLQGGRCKHFLIRALQWLEVKFYNGSYKVSTLTEGMRENICRKVRAKNKEIILFPYWIDFSTFKKDATSRHRFRTRMEFSEDVLVVGYAGNLGHKEKIEHLLEIAKSDLLDHRVIFLIAGDGAEKHTLVSRKDQMGLTNVSFMDLLQGQDYIDFLNGVDLSYISQDAKADKIFIPSKIFKTLSCGSPILCVADKHSELVKLIWQAQAGFVTEFDEIEKTIRLLNELRNERAILDSVGDKAAVFAHENYDRDRIIAKFLRAAEVKS